LFDSWQGTKNQNNKPMDKIKLKPVKDMWVCASEKGGTQPHTISYLKRECIDKMVKGSTMTWKECKEYGWICVKVNLLFETI